MPKILVVTKQSKVEWEQEKFDLDEEGIRAKYSAEHANLDAILKAHERQLDTRQELHELLPTADFVAMNHLTQPVTDYDQVISLGGDNSFSYVTHHLTSTPIIGINSDPGRSTGALCTWNSTHLKEVVDQLLLGNYQTQEWTRLQATINGEPFTSATSEYFFGERERDQMSRHVVVYRGREYEEKNSGIIIATGAGSTGWYRSSGGKAFGKTERKAAFLMTEPYLEPNRSETDVLHQGELELGEELILHSLNDADGRASADSWEKKPFNRGSKAVVRISDQPLRVIVPAG
ncbi:MAG: hypothetical protein AABX70_08490 [Nanoarchaeota archaeon]